MTLIGYMGMGMRTDIGKLKDEHNSCALDLANFKADVASNYANKTDMATLKQENTHSLDRIHERLDTVVEILMSGKVK